MAYLDNNGLSHLWSKIVNLFNKRIEVSETAPTEEENKIWLQPITTNAGAVDYIVDEGVSGIWTYRKWNSGIAECWGIGTVSVTCTNAQGVYYSDPKSIALPSNLFNGDSAASATLADPYCWVTNVVASTSAVSFRVVRGASYSNTFSPRVSLFVKGKWK